MKCKSEFRQSIAYNVIPTEPFEHEYDGIVRYLLETLDAPNAARRLLNDMDKARAGDRRYASWPLLRASMKRA